MGAWWHRLKPVAHEAGRAAEAGYGTEVVLYYLARWCQKRAGAAQPSPEDPSPEEVAQAAAKIARNLAADGPYVERLIGGDPEAWARLRRDLLGSAGRAGAAAGEFADEALQQIAEVLITGTPPAAAAEALRVGPEGPRNEYVFKAPFDFWSRRVVINLVIDEARRQARDRAGPAPVRPAASGPVVERATLEAARDALPGLVNAIGALPPTQRSVMVASLTGTRIDPLVRALLHDLAPELFGDPDRPAPGTDRELAVHLGTTPRRLAANRSAGRRKLADRDPRWALLLDVLLPHRSTRPALHIVDEEDR